MRITDVLSFKHDGTLHRVWKNVEVLHEDEEEAIVLNDHVNVIDGDGHLWHTKEPALTFFYKKSWYNIVCMIRPDSLYYYCNLSSPYVSDTEGIKYIDYDLDVKLYPDGEIALIDEDEFELNTLAMHYPRDIVAIIHEATDELMHLIETRADPFNRDVVVKWCTLAHETGLMAATEIPTAPRVLVS